jgi:hypothetical protein
MEYVSVLAGERFGDHPRCVHPALAAFARAVNDRITVDGVRSRLALLVPDLITVDERDPRVGPQITVTCLLAAAAVRPLPRRAARRLTKASTRLRRTSGSDTWASRAWERCRWAFATPGPDARWAVLFFEDHARPQAGDEHDQKLYDVMCAVVSDCARLGGAGRGQRARPVAR